MYTIMYVQNTLMMKLFMSIWQVNQEAHDTDNLQFQVALTLMYNSNSLCTVFLFPQHIFFSWKSGKLKTDASALLSINSLLLSIKNRFWLLLLWMPKSIMNVLHYKCLNNRLREHIDVRLYSNLCACHINYVVSSFSL